MVSPFSVIFNNRLVFGPGSLTEILKIVESQLSVQNARGKGEGVLVVTGRTFSTGGKLDFLKRMFAERGFKFYTESIHGEPSPDVVDRIVKVYIPHYREGNIGVVVGVGGGSVIDTGKAVSAMLPLCDSFHSVKDFLEGVGVEKPPGVKIPYIAVPTTSGTGSEVTKNAVISEVGKYKKSLRHDNYVPEVAILDPELTMNCPRHITAASGMDALSQLIESYVSIRSNYITDALALEGLRLVSESFIPLCNFLDSPLDSSDENKSIELLELRGKMSIGAYISGLTLANAGLGTVHGIAGVIGGLFGAPHGEICGSLLARVMEVTIVRLEEEKPEHLALYKLAKLGYLLGKKREDSIVETESVGGKYKLLKGCRLLIDTLKEWTEKLGIRRLSEFGVKERDIPLIAERAGNKNNPIPLTPGDIKDILKSRL